jgi:hypothetical protein
MSISETYKYFDPLFQKTTTLCLVTLLGNTSFMIHVKDIVVLWSLHKNYSFIIEQKIFIVYLLFFLWLENTVTSPLANRQCEV